MMNIYTGNVITDELGLATIKLPEWFEAENTDFRYQLTVVGALAPRSSRTSSQNESGTINLRIHDQRHKRTGRSRWQDHRSPAGRLRQGQPAWSSSSARAR